VKIQVDKGEDTGR